MKHYLEVKNLSVCFYMEGETAHAVNDVSYYVDGGEVVCFVGESGSGKSVTQMAGLQLVATPPGKIECGEVWLNDKNLLSYGQNSREMRAVRGGEIGMVFQEPMTSLNPVKTVGEQILEAILLHTDLVGTAAQNRAVELLEEVGIPDAATHMRDYPHQFSGGMRQRIMVAMALAGDPKMLIADEPTTALDVTTQSQILELLKRSTVDRGRSLLLVTHNLGIVARYADRIYVMYAGSVMESGRSEDIFAHPAHPYTRGLLKAVPRLDDEENRKLVPIAGTPLNSANLQEGCPFCSRCPYAKDACRQMDVHRMYEAEGQEHHTACIRSIAEMDAIDASSVEKESDAGNAKQLGETILSVKNLTKEFGGGNLFRRRARIKAVSDVSFSIRQGETLGLVGESGCGKTTAARCIMRMYDDYQGEIRFDGKDFAKLSRREMKQERRRIQMVFQDPYSSLDPRQPAGSIVGEPLIIHHLTDSKGAYERRIDELFELVGLDPRLKNRIAHEFSGGQRQRLGIARALASDPKLIVCDEPISALDVSIQAQIINLMEDIQQKMGISYLFVAHDLAVVKHISDVIVVMYMGQVMEVANSNELYRNPMNPYTQALLAAVPVPDPAVEKQRNHILIKGETPSLVNRPAGCPFFQRCPQAMERCKTENPQLREMNEAHKCACWMVK